MFRGACISYTQRVTNTSSEKPKTKQINKGNYHFKEVVPTETNINPK